MPEGTDVFEIMHTTRAMRRLKPDPVPDELIRNILLAGQAAASGGNTQRWRFLVLKDRKSKRKYRSITRRHSTRWSGRVTMLALRRLGSRLGVTSAHARPTNI